MNLPKDHMPYERCIDILESELGEHEPKKPYAGVHIVQAYRIAIDSMQKQIPVYWKEFTDTNGDTTYTCPICNYWFERMREADIENYKFPKFCLCCGQRIIPQGSYTAIKLL